LSDKEPGKGLRAMIVDVVTEGGKSVMVVAIDTRLLEAPISPRVQQMIQKCIGESRANTPANLIRLRPTIYREIDEIPGAVIAYQKNEIRESTLVDRIFVYTHPPLAYSGIHILEWSIRE
jgi:hypothetical protein